MRPTLPLWRRIGSSAPSTIAEHDRRQSALSGIRVTTTSATAPSTAPSARPRTGGRWLSPDPPCAPASQQTAFPLRSRVHFSLAEMIDGSRRGLVADLWRALREGRARVRNHDKTETTALPADALDTTLVSHLQSLAIQVTTRRSERVRLRGDESHPVKSLFVLNYFPVARVVV